MLKLAALSSDFATLKGLVQSILTTSIDAAAKRVARISVYDLDHIVFGVSDAEGLWEPDMLFRLHSLFHRLEARRLAHSNEELERLAQRLRSVSHIPVSSQSIPTSDAWEIQRQELYADGKHINGLHFPLDLGGIFAKTGTRTGSKRYILLAQPCDLMIRSDGRRYPKIERFALAEVANLKKQPSYAEELPYYGDGPRDKYYVRFGRVHYVDSCILDLRVYNTDGIASIHLGGDCPRGVRPSWRSRLAIIEKRLGRRATIWTTAADGAEVKAAKNSIRGVIEKDLLAGNIFRGALSSEDGK